MPIQTEYCLLCSSLNKIHIDEHSEAWECWNCNERYWVDDLTRIAYIIDNDVSLREANEGLKTRTGICINKLPYFAEVES